MINEESAEPDGLMPGHHEETDHELLMHMSNLNLDDENPEEEETTNVLTMANPVFQEAASSSKVLCEQ